MKTSILYTVLGLGTAALANWPEAEGKSIQFSTVTGYFLQDEVATNPTGFDYVSGRGRLISRSWLRLTISTGQGQFRSYGQGVPNR